MNDLRRSTKTMLLQNATFFGANGWEECIIVESSKGELRIEFHTKEKIKEGSIINIRALIPSVPNPVIVKGILKWIEKKGEYLSGGVEWLSVHKDRI
jgi:hypothetical protein